MSWGTPHKSEGSPYQRRPSMISDSELYFVEFFGVAKTKHSFCCFFSWCAVNVAVDADSNSNNDDDTDNKDDNDDDDDDNDDDCAAMTPTLTGARTTSTTRMTLSTSMTTTWQRRHHFTDKPEKESLTSGWSSNSSASTFQIASLEKKLDIVCWDSKPLLLKPVRDALPPNRQVLPACHTWDVLDL